MVIGELLLLFILITLVFDELFLSSSEAAVVSSFLYVCGCVQVVPGHQQNPDLLTVMSASTVFRFSFCKLPFHSPVYAEEEEEEEGREQASLPHPSQGFKGL